MRSEPGFGRAVRDRWRRFWFAPDSAANLGFCRFAFFALVLTMFVTRDFSALGALSPVFWKPIQLFALLGLAQPSVGVLEVIQTIWRIALVASCLGALTRVSTAVAFVLGTYLLGLLFCFGGLGHAKSILVFAMGTLALSRCGDSLSVDRWIRARRGEPAPAPHFEYRWPIRLIWVAITFVFFGAGISKLRHAGLAWVTSNTLAYYLMQANYPLGRPAAPPMNDWGLWLARNTLASRGLAAGSMLVELAFPVVLFSRRLRGILVAAAFLMQAGIAVVMGPDFSNFLVTYVFWIPWNRLAERVLGRAGLSRLSPEPVVRGSILSP